MVALRDAFQTVHQRAPRGVASDEVVALRSPTGVRESQQSSGLVGLRSEKELGSIPLVACIA
jgi:hypothetical protein